jgi:tetratricopeptide (TPR) repeat protein
VFEGGASVEAAESVLASLNAETSAPPLDLLEHLVDQSLLVIGTTEAGEPRLRMLETVREYASEALMAGGQKESAHGAHVRYFLDWIERTREELTESRDGQAIRAVRGELGNLRGALSWLRMDDLDGRRLQLVNALFPYWRIAGPYTEASDELAGALADGQECAPRQRAWALSALGWLAGARGGFAESISLNEEALELFTTVGDWEQQVEILWQLALAAELMSDYGRARSYHQRRLLLVPADDVLATARIEHDLGRLTFIEGSYHEAIQLLSQAISIFRTYSETQLIAHGLLDLASAELLSGLAGESLDHIGESITLLRTLQDEYGLAIAVVTRGRAEQLAGEYQRAQLTLEQSLADADRLGDASLRSLALYSLGVNAVAGASWREAATRLREAFDINQSIGDRRRAAELLEVMAQVAVGLEKAETAALLLGRARRERMAGATATPPAHLPRLNGAIEAARLSLGQDRFDILVAQGETADAAALMVTV